MAFVDELDISAQAGRGGDGVVRWLHLKGKEFSGPAGGNGGEGGSVYFRAVRDLGALSRYRGEKVFRAGDGAPGEGRLRHGADGESIDIEVPVGSRITNRVTGESFELMSEGECVLALAGGRGGAGNAVFKSSVNRSPREAFPGALGEEGNFYIELRLIADVGLIGLPNAGKTTLLNALTHASGKVDMYPFTTLEPNLGVLHGFVLADIPGLIEGASEGRGLGAKFLRHVARTKILAHCISLELDDPEEAYALVRNELALWDKDLAQKREIIILTKSDTRDNEKIKEISDEFIAKKKEVLVVSALDDASLKRLSVFLTSSLQ
ncbi:MAG: GTPase ObgE [Minisyncoccia bacterium]